MEILTHSKTETEIYLEGLHSRIKRVLHSMSNNNNSVDEAFKQLIAQRGIHNKLGITSEAVRSFRFALNTGKVITHDKKLELLKKSGWKPDHKHYSKDDLASFFRFYNRTSQSARDMGIEYVFEKWEASRK